MTFPTIPTVAAGRVLFANQANTTAARTFPSLSGLTKNSGDLLIAIVCTYQSTTNPQFTSWGGGFTEFSDQGSSTTMGIGMAYKWSNGTETGTFDVTQAATITGHASMCLLSIPGAHASTIPEAGTIANGTAAAADPASFNPAGWGTEDTLWIAVGASGMTSGTGSWTATGTTYPTNYTDGVDSATTDSSTVGQTEIGVAFRQLAAASEDVGTFGVDTSNARNSALLIAVRPAPANQTLTQDATFTSGTNSFYAHTITTGPVTVTQSARFDNSNTYYAHTLSQGGANQDLTQDARFDNSNAFYATQVNLSLAQASRFDNTPAFYAAQVNLGLTQASLFTNSNAFYAAQVNLALTQSARHDNSNAFYAAQIDLALAQASRFDNSNSFYAHTVTTGPVTITQSTRFDNANDFYAHTVTLVGGSQSLTQDSRFDNSNSFYAHTVTTGPVTITQASRFDNSNSFYAHTVTTGPVSLTQASRFDNSGAFYAATLSTFNELLPPLLANTNAFYSHTVTPGAVTLTADLYSNDQTFYGAVVSDGIVYSNLGRDRLGSTPAENPDRRLGGASLMRPEQTVNLNRRTTRLGNTAL